MDLPILQDVLQHISFLEDKQEQHRELNIKLLKQIPLDPAVNQCQGFAYNSKKDVFVLACINSANTVQIIYELDPNTFDILHTYRYEDAVNLAHMNTLTYNPHTNLLYTTNAVVNGYKVTPINADTMKVGTAITSKEKVFNLAYDKGTNRFVSIVPVDHTLRRINYYSPDFILLRTVTVDAHHHDLNNNGAYSYNGNTIFTTLSTWVMVDKNYNITDIIPYPKGLEIEDMDTRLGMMYAAVNVKSGVAIYSVIQ